MSCYACNCVKLSTNLFPNKCNFLHTQFFFAATSSITKKKGYNTKSIKAEIPCTGGDGDRDTRTCNQIRHLGHNKNKRICLSDQRGDKRKGESVRLS